MLAANVADANWISQSPSPGAFPLAAGGTVTGIYYDEDENIAVIKAIKSLRDDISKVTGSTPQLCVDDELPKYPIIVGTLGKSAIIDILADKGIVDRDSLLGKWESFMVRVADKPFPGVERALIIAGSDRRGSIYGIYELSRRLGVSPWYWWLDAPVRHLDEIYVSPVDFFSGEPAVKYRGIFINDEFPCMTAWAKSRFGGMNSDMYSYVYELILRLRGNCMWPAMWGSFKEYRPLEPIYKDEDGFFEGNCFNEDDPLNPRIADEYGIVIGTSHHEPMQRGQQEWIRHKSEYGNGEWNYITNRGGIDKFFADGISKSMDYDIIVTLGMRGEEDCPMVDAGSAEKNFSLMRDIVDRQRHIISRQTGRAASSIPQVFTLYSEMLDYYDQGLDLPDDVIIMFCDDNFGNVRRLPVKDEPKHPGGYGMYYHVGYYGAPRACKWLNATQIQYMWEQLSLTLDHEVNTMWMLNVGDIKPHEFATDFFMEMAWAPQRFNQDNLMDYTCGFCASLFGDEYAKEAGLILDSFNKYSSWIHPELLDHTTYDIDNGEFEYVLSRLLSLQVRARRLENQMSLAALDTYRQLIGYPVEALANLYEYYYNLANYYRAESLAEPSADMWADMAENCFKYDSLLSYNYNNVMSDGKWRHMMDQPHIGYSEWHGPQCNIMPALNRELKPRKSGGCVFSCDKDILIMDASHFYNASLSADNIIWLPGLGRWDGGVKLPGGEGSLDYKFTMAEAADSVNVTLIMKSIMPFVSGGHNIDVVLDGSSPFTIGLDQDLNWEHKYDLMYPTGASRVIRKTVKLPLSASGASHLLTLNPRQPDIVLYKVLIDCKDTPDTHRVYLPESKYVCEN